MAGAEEKEGRKALDSQEKKIFLKIIKETDGGKFENILTRGTSTSMQKHDVWAAIQKLFNQATGRNQTVKQLRTLYQRMKDQSKKNHDAEINRRFASSCSATGGGKGPSPPAEYDGDSFNGEEEFDILDPTPTAWNRLSVRPGSSDRQVQPSQRSFLDSPSVRESPPSLQTRLRALPQFAPAALTRDLQVPAALIRASSPSFSLETPERSVARRPLTTPVSVRSGVRPGPEGVGDVRSGGAQVGRDDEDPTQEMVTIIDAAGATIVAPVVQELSNNNARVNKTRKKKETNSEAGSRYYAEMLVMQRSMMMLRERYIKSKMLSELLKQAVLKNSLAEKGLNIPELELSVENDSNGEEEDEEDEEDNNNIFN